MRDVETIRLYSGKAPGSEEWLHSESENTNNLWGTRIVYNIADPTLSIFRPDADLANGTSVIICPGGAFHALSIDSEGNDVAQALNKHGVTCFVLKYRLVQCRTKDPTREVTALRDLASAVAPVVDLAMADGLASVQWVREHAREYGLKSSTIGMLGFSAGGTVAASVAMNYTSVSRPDFIAPIYLAYNWANKGSGVRTDAPPLFALAASDDPLDLGPESVEIYQDWISAGKSAELHLYSTGGHGFGMRRQNLPSDQWIERFTDWMCARGLLEC